MSPGGTEPAALLEALHRIMEPGRALEAMLGDLAETSGDALAGFLREGEAGGSLTLRAVRHRDAGIARRWRRVLAGQGGSLQPELALVSLMGQRHVVSEIRAGRRARVLVAPILAASRVAGAIACLRDLEREPFSVAEIATVRSVGVLAGLQLRLGDQDRAAEASREAFELVRGSLRILGGQLDSALALQPLAVQARQALQARALAIFQADPALWQVELVAGVGLGAVPAPATWAVAGIPFFERPLAGRRPSGGWDLATLPLPATADSLRCLLGGAGEWIALPLLSRQDALGVILIALDPCTTLAPDRHVLAGQVAELAALLVAHARLGRREVEARAGERVAEALAAQREGLVRQIVHDLRNAVHVLGLAVDEIDRKAADAAHVRAALGPVSRQVDFMAGYLVAKLRSLDDPGREGPLRATLEDGFARLLADRADKPGLGGRRLALGPCPDARLLVPQVQLDEILSGLVDVAAHVSAPGATLDLWCTVSDGWATIRLEDDGPGLSPHAQATLVEESLAGPPLRMVETLVAAAGGHFGLHSRAGDRTAFHVGLPTAAWGGGALE